MAETTSGVATVDTPIGTLGVEATIEGITRVRLPGARRPATIPGDPEATAVARNAADQLAEYVRGERTTFELALDWDVVSGEHRRVLEILAALAPYGHTVTYGELAARSGVADARDVGV
jgi:methylated-DNA-[protein]-cysteine S-methyltransferase